MEVAGKPLTAKQAPRRLVIEAIRDGDWGEVTYRHRLSCGHTIVRKRLSAAVHLACVPCLKAKKFSEGTIAPAPIDDDATIFTAEIKNEQAQTKLASILGVPATSVDIVVDASGHIRYGLIFVSKDDILRIVG